MKVRDLIHDLREHQDLDVEVSLNGEQPVRVRGMAKVDDHIVLMAVPTWSFSELDQAMQQLGAVAATTPGWVDWECLFERRSKDDGTSVVWRCRAHSLTPDHCDTCRVATHGGYHYGAAERGRRYCNCHSKLEGSCADGVRDLATKTPRTLDG